jgi:hypothetical protein
VGAGQQQGDDGGGQPGGGGGCLHFSLHFRRWVAVWGER